MKGAPPRSPFSMSELPTASAIVSGRAAVAAVPRIPVAIASVIRGSGGPGRGGTENAKANGRADGGCAPTAPGPIAIAPIAIAAIVHVRDLRGHCYRRLRRDSHGRSGRRGDTDIHGRGESKCPCQRHDDLPVHLSLH